MQYNKSQIMKSAWRAFKMKSNTKTFGECLKSAWSLEKMYKGIKAEVKTKRDKLTSKKFDSNNGTRVSYNNVADSAFYNSSSRGYMGSSYVGD